MTLLRLTRSSVQTKLIYKNPRRCADEGCWKKLQEKNKLKIRYKGLMREQRCGQLKTLRALKSVINY